jgi:hypothetical protein
VANAGSGMIFQTKNGKANTAKQPNQIQSMKVDSPIVCITLIGRGFISEGP